MSVAAEMPKYKCHKEVWALKIAGISLPQNEAGDGELAFEGGRFAPILMPKAWLDKHNPEVGGYYVVYKDGYKSYSPAEAFEEGYTSVSAISKELKEAVELKLAEVSPDCKYILFIKESELPDDGHGNGDPRQIMEYLNHIYGGRVSIIIVQDVNNIRLEEIK